MSSDKVFGWLPSNPRLKQFYDGVAQFVEDNIDAGKSRKYQFPKEILDPCVGYIKLNSWEIAIIDTPLFQRLRKITQLGLAYQVYPTLRYSRLEHTFGVVGRLNQILQKLREKHHTRLSEENEKLNLDGILEQYETQIRLAAIFHDVGHCIFSHLSESVISELPGVEDENYPSVKEIVNIFNHQFALDDTNLSISEIFSITILGVKKVAEILYEGNIYIHSKLTDMVTSKNLRSFR